MPKQFITLATMGFLLAAHGACQPTEPKRRGRDKAVMPAFVAGTVAEYATLSGGSDFRVQGYGLVVGLGDKGSREIPPMVEQYFVDYLNKRDVGSHVLGGGRISPKKILRSLDTAIVLVEGSIPKGSPKGTRFDVFVRAIPQVQSLEGGTLWPTELRLAVGSVRVDKGSKILAEADGTVFVNPFVDTSKPGARAKLREGRIIGGGEVVEARKLRLQLFHPEYDRCRFIENRINERLSRLDERVANATSPSTINLSVPKQNRRDYLHFLRLISHLSLRSGAAGQEAHAREIIEAMKLPGADHDELAIVWEAMGKQVIPTIQTLYTLSDDAMAFYAARTGLRLGDRTALTVVIHYATKDWQLQLEAIGELGRASQQRLAVPALRSLIDHDNERIRLAAYNALIQHRDGVLVKRTDVSGQFKLDLVASTSKPIIYATQTGEAKIVLFVKDITVNVPVFFASPDELVTVNAYARDKKLAVFRKVPGRSKVSDVLKSDLEVAAFIRTLGLSPAPDLDGNISGLGLTYSQVVGVLYRMCQAEHIRANFVLQQLPSPQRIYGRSSTVGRPDTPR